MQKIWVTIRQILILALLIVLIIPTLAGANPEDRINEAVQVLQEIQEQIDVEAMVQLLDRSKGIAIFPSVIKAGIMIGGRYGEGLVLSRDSVTGQWNGPYFVTMKGASYGLQIGVQSTALILVIANERGMESFKDGKITLGGNLSVAAGPVGRSAEAGTDLDLKTSIYSYSMSRGVFAGMSFEGSIIERDVKTNRDYWRTDLSISEMLNRPANTPEVKPLITEIDRLITNGKLKSEQI